ncbi:MAG TPA: hypothetical protein ENI27_09655 [bacterium]|nr:hypothetical protein [bacterium]
MKRFFLILLLVTILTPTVFGQVRAVVKEVNGKVEVKVQSGGWERARVGMGFSPGSYISTGFNSTALLELGSTLLQVKPLTRMKLEELIRREDTVTTGLFLRVGRVRAEVKSVKGIRQEFKLKSPLSTAAVRGTEFEYDGVTVKVINGVVYLYNRNGQKRSVAIGEQSSAGGDDPPTTGEQEKSNVSEVVPYTAPGGGGSDTDGDGDGDGNGNGEPIIPTDTTVTITWTW